MIWPARSRGPNSNTTPAKLSNPGLQISGTHCQRQTQSFSSESSAVESVCGAAAVAAPAAPRARRRRVRRILAGRARAVAPSPAAPVRLCALVRRRSPPRQAVLHGCGRAPPLPQVKTVHFLAFLQIDCPVHADASSSCCLTDECVCAAFLLQNFCSVLKHFCSVLT